MSRSAVVGFHRTVVTVRWIASGAADAADAIEKSRGRSRGAVVSISRRHRHGWKIVENSRTHRRSRSL